MVVEAQTKKVFFFFLYTSQEFLYKESRREVGRREVGRKKNPNISFACSCIQEEEMVKETQPGQFDCNN